MPERSPRSDGGSQGCLYLQDPQDNQFAAFISSLEIPRDGQGAWHHIEQVITRVIKDADVGSVCEIGGGRSPLLSEADARALGITYTVNDISSDELELAPPWVDKTCFDIGTSHMPEEQKGKFDLVFSNMVFEHVRDTRQAYKNVQDMLRAGGITVHYHPVLYALPFVANIVMPEVLSRYLLRLVPRRLDLGPKFPAYYSNCVVNQNYIKMLREVGFSEIVLVPIYGHSYLQNIPLIGPLENLFSDLASRWNFTLYASYCFASLSPRPFRQPGGPVPARFPIAKRCSFE